jgi:hypothetical protein
MAQDKSLVLACICLVKSGLINSDIITSLSTLCKYRSA